MLIYILDLFFLKIKQFIKATFSHTNVLKKSLVSLGFPIILSLFLFYNSSPCQAIIEFKKDSVIVDDEIEEILSNWVSQLFKVAGLKNHKPKIFLVVNSEINASATLGGVMIVHTGLISKCQNAGQLLGVLAHEVGHIAGGHVSRSDQAMLEALVPSSAAMILGGALALATGDPSLLMAGLMGGSHAFDRSMMKFSRAQESSADHAAITYLNKLGWGCGGLCEFFKILHDRTAAYASRMSPYAISHPLTGERIKSVEHHVKHTPSKSPSCQIESDFQRLRGKVLGFFEPPKKFLQSLSSHKLSPTAQQYAKSIVLYRLGRYKEALADLDHLIQATGANSSDSVWYYEMKGQILFDTGKIKEAIQMLEQAASKRPQAKYLKIMLAHALMEDKETRSMEKARAILLPITQQDPDNPFAWRLLAQAHGKGNEPGLALLALAEEALQKDEKDFAKLQVKKAIKILPAHSPGAQRAKDLLREITGEELKES